MNNRRKRTIIWWSSTLAIAVIVHLATVLVLPYGIMYAARKAMAGRAGEKGIFFSDRPTPADQSFRHLARDLIYSAAPYDVSESALHIEAPVPDSYMAITIYASDGEAFFTMNDRQIDDKVVDLTLVGPGVAHNNAWVSGTVRSPTSRGIIILRYFVPDEESLAEIKEKQLQLKFHYGG